MTPELVALGRRSVACKGFRWIPGMWVVFPEHKDFFYRIVWVRPEESPEDSLFEATSEEHGSLDGISSDENFVVDLSDPATLGCLLALVREAHGSDCAHAWTPTRSQGRWIVSRPEREGDYPSFNPDGWFSLSVGEHATEAEALVSALENAP